MVTDSLYSLYLRAQEKYNEGCNDFEVSGSAGFVFMILCFFSHFFPSLLSSSPFYNIEKVRSKIQGSSLPALKVMSIQGNINE